MGAITKLTRGGRPAGAKLVWFRAISESQDGTPGMVTSQGEPGEHQPGPYPWKGMSWRGTGVGIDPAAIAGNLIKLNVPALIGHTPGGDDTEGTLAWFSMEFALGADLEERGAFILDPATWSGLPPHLTAERDQADAELGDRINAIMSEAHVRNRWDLLDVWYPAVWEAMHRSPILVWPGPGIGSIQTAIPLPDVPWPGLSVHLQSARDKVLASIEDGTAIASREARAAAREEWGLPSPKWIAPYVEYRAHWWVLPYKAHWDVDKLTHKFYPSVPWVDQTPGGLVGAWERGTWATGYAQGFPYSIVEPLTIPEDPDWKDMVFAVVPPLVLTFAAGALASGWADAIWGAVGNPLGPAASELTSNFLGGALEGAISGDNPIDSGLSGLVGDLEPLDLLDDMGIFDDLSGWTGAATDALGGLGEDISDLLGIVEDVDSVADIIFGQSGGGGPIANPPGYPPHPVPPPLPSPGEQPIAPGLPSDAPVVALDGEPMDQTTIAVLVGIGAALAFFAAKG